MDKNTEDNLKKAAKELAEKTGKAADIAKDKIASQMESENVKNATQAAAKAAKESKEKFTKHGKSFAQDVRELKGGAKTEKNWRTAFKIWLLICAVALIALFIHEMVGFDMVFEYCALIALAVLIYMAVKKKPKKNAAIALIVFIVLSEIFGVMDGRVPDNVLYYMGTKTRSVYRTYDKGDFYETGLGVKGMLTNEENNHSGLPHIILYDGQVTGIKLESSIDASFNVEGLYIGDSADQVATCTAKLNADMDPESFDYDTQSASGKVVYNFKYKGKDLQLIVFIDFGRVSTIFIGGA